MGLDGISVNQIRLAQESNSAELNSKARFAPNKDTKAIDGLAQGQVIDPDKEREHGKNAFKNNKDDGENEDVENEDNTETLPIQKYDLSQTDKYTIKTDKKSNEISIIENKTGKVIQVLDSEVLSKFVNYLADAKGSIINRKY